MDHKELQHRRQQLELTLANEQMSDSSKNRLILKLLNLLETELEEVDGDIG